MKIIICKAARNSRIPVILGSSHAPLYLPLLYTTLQMRTNAFNTKKIHVHAIFELYKFHESKLINLEKLIIQGKFTPIINSLDEFIQTTGINRYNDRLHAIRTFLIWNIRRYSKFPERFDGIVTL